MTASQLKTHPTEDFVRAAVAAAKLHQITTITSRMHISALNAKIITAHAGEIGRGFQPLTEFITELAKETTSIVNTINKEALLYSKTAVNNSRTESARNRFSLALQKHDKENISVNDVISQIQITESTYAESLHTNLRQINKLLANIEYQTRSAKFISANCRIEASHVPQFQANFEAVAQTLETSTDEIKSYVSDCRKILFVTL